MMNFVSETINSALITINSVSNMMDCVFKTMNTDNCAPFPPLKPGWFSIEQCRCFIIKALYKAEETPVDPSVDDEDLAVARRFERFGTDEVTFR